MGTLASALTLNNAELTTNIVNSSLTALAIIVGGFWTYFKFARGRTFKCRAETTVTGSWHSMGGRSILKFKVTTKNVGSSKFPVIKEGTFFYLSRLSDSPVSGPTGILPWHRPEIKHPLFSYPSFNSQNREWWLEPGEWTDDEFLIDLKTAQPVTVRYDAFIVYRERKREYANIHECGVILAEGPA